MTFKDLATLPEGTLIRVEGGLREGFVFPSKLRTYKWFIGIPHKLIHSIQPESWACHILAIDEEDHPWGWGKPIQLGINDWDTFTVIPARDFVLYVPYLTKAGRAYLKEI